jgi:hypothetical protein
MNMPGFTAEASLYKTSEDYHMAGTAAPLAHAQSVLPQWCYTSPSGYVCCWTPWFGWNCRRLLTVE